MMLTFFYEFMFYNWSTHNEDCNYYVKTSHCNTVSVKDVPIVK